MGSERERDRARDSVSEYVCVANDVAFIRVLLVCSRQWAVGSVGLLTQLNLFHCLAE